MKVRCYDNSYLEDCLTVGRIYDVKEIKENYYVIKDDKGITNLFWHGDFEIVKENEMEKTFREVIADIKKGEVWECLGIKITKDSDSIQMLGFGKNTIFMDSSRIFNLQRKEYTFEEAFKAYEDGKEIESCFSGQKFRIYSWEDVFNAKEIKEKWYINN